MSDDECTFRMPARTFLTSQVNGEKYVRYADVMSAIDELLLALLDTQATNAPIAVLHPAILEGQIAIVQGVQRLFDIEQSLTVTDPFTVKEPVPAVKPAAQFWKEFFRGFFRTAHHRR